MKWTETKGVISLGFPKGLVMMITSWFLKLSPLIRCSPFTIIQCGFHSPTRLRKSLLLALLLSVYAIEHLSYRMCSTCVKFHPSFFSVLFESDQQVVSLFLPLIVYCFIPHHRFPCLAHSPSVSICLDCHYIKYFPVMTSTVQ